MAGAEQVMSSDKESRPSPIDVHVGSRIRLRRTLLGMSQGGRVALHYALSRPAAGMILSRTSSWRLILRNMSW